MAAVSIPYLDNGHVLTLRDIESPNDVSFLRLDVKWVVFCPKLTHFIRLPLFNAAHSLTAAPGAVCTESMESSAEDQQ